MVKSLQLQIAIIILLISVSTNSFSAWNGISSEKQKSIDISLINSDVESSVLSMNLSGYNLKEVSVNGNSEYLVSSPGSSSFLKAGAPDLGKIACSVIIPETGIMKVEVLSASFKDFENISVAPSKGNLTRNINPMDVPYVKGNIYNADEFWPSSLASLADPYILRDYRGQAVTFNPFQYNPVKKTLRVYTNITVKVSRIVASSGINELIRKKPLEKIDPEFAAIYSSQFKNINSVQYVPLGEAGDLLIICPSQWISLMQPLADWKMRKGIKTEIVDILTAGGYNSSLVQTYISNYYSSHNLSYVLLVGDILQIPSPFTAGGVSDPVYGFLTGGDAYSEVFIGRFSSESAQDVVTQVNRSLDYERNADISQTGYGNAIVIGSDQGPGDDGEMDWEHAHNMGLDLSGYTYNSLSELYDGTQSGTTDAPGDPVSSDLVSLMQSGTGVITYTGHGSANSISTTGFSNADIGNLQIQNNLPFIWSVACVNGDFSDSNGPCLAEGLMRSQSNGFNTGAAATFMASINQSWDPPMDAQDEMVDILTHQYPSNYKRTFSGISFNGCFHMNDQYGQQGSEMTATWHVFGDPTLEVRTAAPTAMTVSHPVTVNLGTTAITVNCNTDYATVCFNLSGDILATQTVINGIAQLNFPSVNVIDTIFVTVTALNQIPYQGYVLILPSTQSYVTYQTHLNHDFNGNSDGLPDYGELISMDVTLKDLSAIDAINVSAQITCSDTNIVLLTNGFQSWGTINGNSFVKVDSSFTYLIKNNVPDQHVVTFTLYIRDNSGSVWTSQIHQTLNAPSLEIISLYVNDSLGGNNNKLLESNESANLFFQLKNIGHSDAGSGNALVSTTSNFLTLNGISKAVGNLGKQSSKNISFNVTMGPNVAIGNPYDVSLNFSAGMYSTSKLFMRSAGEILEDFETGNLLKYNWFTRGNTLWSVTNMSPYQGLYSAISGNINDGERTDLEITLNVLSNNDSITFWNKVSSEAGWDFMRYYYDGTQLSEWSGNMPWTYNAFPSEQGIHVFTFSYEKDLVNSAGSDCAWLDNVRLPFNASITGVKTITYKNNSILYPNPASDNFNIKFDQPQSNFANIVISDLKGSVVAIQNFGQLKSAQHILNIDCSNLTGGLYFVKLESSEGVKIFKLNIQR